MNNAARFRRILVRTVIGIVALVLCLATLLAGWMWYVIASHDTETLPVRHGQVDSQLFARDGAPQPLLVGLGGSEGGNSWASDAWAPQRERFLSQGYAMLTLGYFGSPDTPERLDRISLDAVMDAIDRAAADPRIDGRCVVLLGGSKGAELALSLASREPEIRGVVALVPGDGVFAGLTDALTTSSWTWRNEPLPFLPVPWNVTGDLIVGNLRAVFAASRAALPEHPDAAIAVENINGPILFVSATKDEMWPSSEMSDAMMKRLDANAFAYPHQHLPIEGGHAAPLDHFDAVETFLAEHIGTDGRCGNRPG